MAIANCGGLVLDGSTLKMVNGIITVADGNPTSGVVANCGGVQFDATYFKKVGKVITDKNVTTVSESMTANCGGLLLDSSDVQAEISAFAISSLYGSYKKSKFPFLKL